MKIPHRGSANVDNDRVWGEMLCRSPYAVLTPYNRGASQLPLVPDIDRIRSLTANSYSTARLTSRAPRKLDRSVERSLERAAIVLRSSEIKMGHVRLRRDLSAAVEADWRVELFGNAVPLAHVLP